MCHNQKVKIMNEFNIGNLRIKTPIVQGGMGVGVSLSGLASAVANEGGIGVISAVAIGMLQPNFRKNFKESNAMALRNEIRKARSKTDGVLGVNIMLAVTDFDNLLKVSLEEKIDVAIVGAGLFLKKPENIEDALFENQTTKFVPKVSSGRAAKLIFQRWSDRYNYVPDAVIVEGPQAGGHLGFSKKDLANSIDSLPRIVAETVKEVAVFEQKYGIEIPVIAGGGISNGKEMFDVMSYGAKGALIGSRFVTTTECDVSDKFKQEYMSSGESDVTLIDSPVGLPGRVIANDFVREIQQGNKKPVKCPWRCLKTCDHRKVQFCVAEALFNAARGDFKNGFAFAGSKAYLADKIISVKETIEQFRSEYLVEQMRHELVAV